MDLLFFFSPNEIKEAKGWIPSLLPRVLLTLLISLPVCLHLTPSLGFRLLARSDVDQRYDVFSLILGL